MLPLLASSWIYWSLTLLSSTFFCSSCFPCRASTHKPVPTHTKCCSFCCFSFWSDLLSKDISSSGFPCFISCPENLPEAKLWFCLRCFRLPVFSSLVSETLQWPAAGASSGFLLDLNLIQILGVGIICYPWPSQKTTQSLLRVSLDPFFIELRVWYMNGRYCALYVFEVSVSINVQYTLGQPTGQSLPIYIICYFFFLGFPGCLLFVASSSWKAISN